jgi:peptidoglycan LD-endopeptidase LytH
MALLKTVTDVKKMPKKMIKGLLLLMSFTSMQMDSSDVKFMNYPEIYSEFKQILVDIRENRESPTNARNRFQDVMKALKAIYPYSNYDSASVKIVFPLSGFDHRAIGGKGTGYRAKGFDLFDNSKKGSHPAHDIFIKDKNQDCVDDRILTYIDVVSVSEGVVVATETDWQSGSDYRGGNYIWIYDFLTGGLWYYAHQRKVFVEPGQIVKAGDKIAEVGRTGFNAAMPRSDTHLHMTYLRIDQEGNPFPVNTFGWLQNAVHHIDPRVAIDLNIRTVFLDVKPLNISSFRFLNIQRFNSPKIRNRFK